MNNAGSPDNSPDTSPEAEKRKRSRSSILLLPVLGLLVIGAAVLMLQFFPILYGILFPPMPPLPAGVQAISHRNLSYGVDEWTYQSTQRGCEVAQFYRDKGGLCPQPYQCLGIPDDEPLPVGQSLAQCTGVFDFSMFTMRWIATISSDESSGFETVFQVSREIFWGGEIPPSMDDLVEQIETGQTATPAK